MTVRVLFCFVFFLKK